MKSTLIVAVKLSIYISHLYDQVYCNENETEDLDDRVPYGRRVLPLDISNIIPDPDDLRCGETYSISQEGYLIFAVHSKRPCHYSFLGSNTEKCTATVYCDRKITLAKPDIGLCKKEVFVITDGTEGLMTELLVIRITLWLMSGCGTFHFGKTPRVPRSKGKDLYVYFRGTSRNSKCVVFCAEDLKDNGKLKPAMPTLLSKNYNGLRMDNSCVCGKLNDVAGRIVGGTTAIKFEFPWMAAIVFKGAGYERSPFCGGSIVNNMHVITAAHCFVETGATAGQIEIILHAHVMDKWRDENGNIPGDDDPNYQDIPGWSLPLETDKSENSIRLEVESVLVHPLFYETYDFDIAIIKLKTTVNFKTPEVSPICLPKIEEAFLYSEGENLLVAGWGKPHENARAMSRLLQKLDVRYMNLTNCRKYTKATSRHLCAGHIEGNKDGCFGDSGGPLIHSLPGGNQYMLSGIASAGNGCAREGNMGLYTNIQELIQWIYYHTDTAVWCRR